MAARICPDCMHAVPATKVLAYSNTLICPNCEKPLEVSMISRYMAVFVGLIAAVIVWWAASKHYANESWALAWVLPIVFSYFGFSLVTPILLAVVADLQPREVQEVVIVHSDAGHHSSH